MNCKLLHLVAMFLCMVFTAHGMAFPHPPRSTAEHLLFLSSRLAEISLWPWYMWLADGSKRNWILIWQWRECCHFHHVYDGRGIFPWGPILSQSPYFFWLVKFLVKHNGHQGQRDLDFTTIVLADHLRIQMFDVNIFKKISCEVCDGKLFESTYWCKINHCIVLNLTMGKRKFSVHPLSGHAYEVYLKFSKVISHIWNPNRKGSCPIPRSPVEMAAT